MAASQSARRDTSYRLVRTKHCGDIYHVAEIITFAVALLLKQKLVTNKRKDPQAGSARFHSDQCSRGKFCFSHSERGDHSPSDGGNVKIIRPDLNDARSRFLARGKNGAEIQIVCKYDKAVRGGMCHQASIGGIGGTDLRPVCCRNFCF